MRKGLRVTEGFLILVVVVVTQMCTFVNSFNSTFIMSAILLYINYVSIN